MNNSRLTKCLVVAAFGLAVVPALANGKVVSVLPELTEGAYVLGSSTSTAAATAAGAVDYDYIDWTSLNVPAGSTVKLNGAIVLDALPDDLTYDWSACTRLALVGASLRTAGKSLVVPSALTRFLAYNGTVNVSGESFTITKGSTPNYYDCSTELNAVMECWSGYGPAFRGALTGASTGEIQLNNFGTGIDCYGSLDFAGWLKFGQSQQQQAVLVKTPDASATVGNVYMHMYENADYGKHIWQKLLYDPQRTADSDPSTLTIGYLEVSGGAGGIYSGADQYRRSGSHICVYSNNAVTIKSIFSNGAFVGLYAGKEPFYKCPNMPKSFDLGVGNVVFDIANGTNMAGRFYVSPNINVTWKGQHAAYSVNWHAFYYTVETNIVNDAALLSFRSVSTAPDVDCLKVYANEPMDLPRKIQGRYGHETRTYLRFNRAAWTMPFDFGAADANPARCETDVTVLAPGSGTVYVKNVTTDADAAYPRKWTEYPVVTYGATTNDFSNWTVTPVGWPGNVKIEKVVKSTGLYVKICQSLGLYVVFR